GGRAAAHCRTGFGYQVSVGLDEANIFQAHAQLLGAYLGQNGEGSLSHFSDAGVQEHRTVFVQMYVGAATITADAYARAVPAHADANSAALGPFLVNVAGLIEAAIPVK